MKLRIGLITVAFIVVIWSIAFFKAPKLPVRFIDMWIEPRDDYWDDFNTLSTDLKQLAITLEVTNNYDKDIKLIGVYSRKLAQLSLQSRLYNYPGQKSIRSKKAERFTIYFLLKEEILLDSINIKQDFLVYSSFSGEMTFDTVETSWQGHPIVAPLFGIGYSRIH